MAVAKLTGGIVSLRWWFFGCSVFGFLVVLCRCFVFVCLFVVWVVLVCFVLISAIVFRS